ncbi:hypothetical protein BH18ACI4_BH18ACI4_12270 [soil metagenome]
MESVATARRESQAVIDLLDFCKGVAIVWIVLVHALHGWFGWQGVHVFITLGGFTLTYACLHRKQQLTWKQWFLKRAERILPAYWLVATAGFLVVCLVAMLTENVKRPLELSAAVWKWLADLTLLRNFSYKNMLADPNSALWFIPLIVSLYLIFPWLYSSLAKHRGVKTWAKVSAAAVAVEIVYRAVAIYWLDGMPVAYGHGFLKFVGRPEKPLNELADAFKFQLWAPFGLAPSRVGEFELGMVAAFALQWNSAKFKLLLLSRWATFVGVVLWLGGNAMLLVGRWSWVFADLFIAAGLVLWLINLAKLAQGVFPRVFKKMSRLGEWSYYVFLTHLLFGYAHANLYVLWAGSLVMVMLMLLLTLVAIIASSWLLLRLDCSGLPQQVFRWVAAAFSRPWAGSKLAVATQARVPMPSEMKKFSVLPRADGITSTGQTSEKGETAYER